MKQHLPAHPSLSQLKHQAKDLLRQLRAAQTEAIARFREHYPRPSLSGRDAPMLSEAQFVVAREYGFASWSKLKQHVEGLESVDARVARLRDEFARSDAGGRRRLLRPAHAVDRFENYNPDAPSLSEADARLLVANQEGYAFWSKYESYLYLDSSVQAVIAAVRAGDREKVREILRSDPEAANPHWAPGFPPPNPVPNDSIPLFCVSEGVFRGTNAHGNAYALVRDLAAAGAEVDFAGGMPLAAAASFNVIPAAEALLDCRAVVDGVDHDGTPLSYALHFGFRDLAELLAHRGAKLDLRFAAGLGKLDAVKDWFHPDGSLKPGAGALVDPYALERKLRGESPYRCERTRENILSQSLYFACVHDRLEAAEFLLAQGADINAIVPGLDVRATILHRIASTEAGGPDAPRNLALMVRFLLDHGADPAVRDKEYHATPIGWACHAGRQEAIDLLIGYAGIHDAVTCGRVDRVRTLLAQDASLANALDLRGRTPLHVLHPRVRQGVEIIDLLVEAGADLNQLDPSGATALSNLSKSGAVDLAEHLRSLGAVEGPNLHGRSRSAKIPRQSS